MWWDIHLKYRTALVKFHRFSDDEEEYEDVLDDIQQEKEMRAERRKERKEQEKKSDEWIAEQQAFKQGLIDTAYDREKERNHTLGLPVREKTKEDVIREKAEKIKKQKEARAKMD
mgnify:FL=1